MGKGVIYNGQYKRRGYYPRAPFYDGQTPSNIPGTAVWWSLPCDADAALRFFSAAVRASRARRAASRLAAASFAILASSARLCSSANLTRSFSAASAAA